MILLRNEIYEPYLSRYLSNNTYSRLNDHLSYHVMIMS